MTKLKPYFRMAGDLIIDWIIHEDERACVPGGVGNVYRGLSLGGFAVQLTTVWNPTLFPLSDVFNLSPQSISDFDYQNVYIRNYNTGTFQRYKKGLRPGVFVVDTDIAILHENSCVREVRSANYVDARDTSATGTTKILRLSSDNDWKAIMKRWDYWVAIVTYNDHAEIFLPDGTKEVCEFPEIAEPVDTIGAGDTFSVGFLRSWYSTRKSGLSLAEYVYEGIFLAQQKVEKVGVFFDDEVD